MITIRTILFTLATVILSTGDGVAAGWRGGVAVETVTPPQWMPMSGYASRGAKHADGKLTDLWAKALVMEDAQGHQAVLITLDLIGIDRELSRRICHRISRTHGLQRQQIAICTSHTHTGPVVATTLRPMHYMLLNETDRQLVDDYASFLEDRIATAVETAFDRLLPAEFFWTSGTGTFAVNRRNNKADEVPALRAAGKLAGPSDHAVPVLVMKQQDQIRSLVFGYACHCTTLSTFEWSGDYAGFAQLEVEKDFPAAVALFWAGCGGDQNPLPRRTVELARQYGRELADAVKAAVSKQLHPVDGALQTDYREVELPLAQLPTREELEEQSSSANQYIAARARHHLARLQDGEAMRATYPYPIGSWNVGDDVQWLFLGGEVVVDYAIRLKELLGNAEQDNTNIWCAAYANDVMAYIPSKRVLLEGGYEGGGAMIYYGLPTVWAPEVEETIVTAVQSLSE